MSARLLDGEVMFNFEFRRLPRSLACRPYWVDLEVSGYDRRGGFRVVKQRVFARKRGSGMVRLPAEWRPPYIARVTASTVDETKSQEATVRLR